jgi:hypothetical protein
MVAIITLRMIVLYTALSRYVDKSLNISHEDTALLLEPLPIHETKEQQQQQHSSNLTTGNKRAMTTMVQRQQEQ